jgi:hypothetical protein
MDTALSQRVYSAVRSTDNPWSIIGRRDSSSFWSVQRYSSGHNLSQLKGIGQLLCLSRLQKQSTLAKPRDGNVPWRMIMKNILRICATLAVVLALLVPVVADTIRLKDGSVIRGQVVGFKDQQFTVLIGSGAQGRRSRTLIYVEDVESIEFDSETPAGASGTTNEDSSSTNPNSGQVYQPPRTNPSTDTNRPPARTDTVQSPTSGAPTFFTIKVAVRADNANNGWTNSGLVVRKGQRLRISATGRVALDKRGDRYSTPAGIPGGIDNDKLMRTEATGALIAVIGDDNDDFLLIGTRRDFVAQRDGVLFLGVNEGNLNDNTGTFDVVIEAEAGMSAPR